MGGVKISATQGANQSEHTVNEADARDVMFQLTKNPEHLKHLLGLNSQWSAIVRDFSTSGSLDDSKVASFASQMPEEVVRERYRTAVISANEMFFHAIGLIRVAIEQGTRARRAVSQRAVTARLSKSPKAAVMTAIKADWTARKESGERINATQFAKQLSAKHHGMVTVEAIKNAQTKWSKAYHPAR